MNLIEQLGGYESAKKFINGECADGFDVQGLRDVLLEYRRTNNIFEDGDLVVFKTLGDGHVHKFSEFHDFKYDLRHATPEEIKAGKRL